MEECLSIYIKIRDKAKNPGESDLLSKIHDLICFITNQTSCAREVQQRICEELASEYASILENHHLFDGYTFDQRFFDELNYWSQKSKDKFPFPKEELIPYACDCPMFLILKAGQEMYFKLKNERDAFDIDNKLEEYKLFNNYDIMDIYNNVIDQMRKMYIFREK